MELRQLRCFIAVADELHFGRAARRLGMMPSALGRHVKLLEEQLATRLLQRTTRHVALTTDGAALLTEAKSLVEAADRLQARARARRGTASTRLTLRVGVIDTVASGLMPLLLKDLKREAPALEVTMHEDKTVRLLPRLLSGRLDAAIVRPPAHGDRHLERQFLFYETAVVALPSRHRLARRKAIRIADLVDLAMILPDRHSRPHSHDLTIKLFERIGAAPTIAFVAEEKQTIVTLVAAKLGAAIVPKWTARMALPGVTFARLIVPGESPLHVLPLALMWPDGARDPAREIFAAVLTANLARYARHA